MTSILRVLAYGISGISYLIPISYFLPFKLSIKEKIFLYLILLTNILLIGYALGNIGVILLLSSTCFYVSIIRKDKLVNSCALFTSYLFCVIIDQLYSLLWNAFLSVSWIHSNSTFIFYVISYTLIVALICPGVSKRFHLLICKIKEVLSKHLIILITVNLFVCLFLFLFNIIIGDYIGYNSKAIRFNCILFGCYFIINTILIVHITKANVSHMELKKKLTTLHDLQEYTAQIETMYSSLRSFKHDYSNLMLTISGYIETDDMKGLRSYFENHIMPLSKKIIADNARFDQLMNLKNTETKSIVSSKLLNAMEANISVHVEVLEEIDIIPIDTVDLTRILGIFLDNAMEAAIETEQPTIRFVAIRSKESCTFVIMNTFSDKKLTLPLLKQAHISTKGSNRGIGLSNVQEIVTKYKNVYWDTEIKEEYFIQRLSICNTMLYHVS